MASPDPGLSPLGTDDEAGGNAPSPQQIAQARSQEISIGAHIGVDAAHAPKSTRGWSAIIMASVIVLFAVMIVATVLLPR